MTIVNSTQDKTFHYFVECPGASNCGTLGPEGEAVFPVFDNKPNVKVTLTILQTGNETEVIVADPGL